MFEELFDCCQLEFLCFTFLRPRTFRFKEYCTCAEGSLQCNTTMLLNFATIRGSAVLVAGSACLGSICLALLISILIELFMPRFALLMGSLEKVP